MLLYAANSILHAAACSSILHANRLHASHQVRKACVAVLELDLALYFMTKSGIQAPKQFPRHAKMAKRCQQQLWDVMHTCRSPDHILQLQPPCQWLLSLAAEPSGHPNTPLALQDSPQFPGSVLDALPPCNTASLQDLGFGYFACFRYIAAW